MVKMQTGHGSPVTLYDSTDTEIGGAASPLKVSSVPTASTTVTTAQTTVSATAVLLLPLDTTRLGGSISNAAGTVTLWIGGVGVTAATGFGVPAGSAYNIDVPNITAAIYGIVSSTAPLISTIALT